MWSVGTTDEFDLWFDAQSAQAREEITAIIGLLRSRGPFLSRPYADTLNGSRFSNMKELRVDAKRMAIRIAFAFDPKRNAIVLVAGDKRGVSEARFYRQLIAKADLLFEDHLRKTR
ncbi:MAG: type II toxin-antitoxin system RelE/ParE family toxin [Tepidisphaerales bacterium]